MPKAKQQGPEEVQPTGFDAPTRGNGSSVPAPGAKSRDRRVSRAAGEVPRAQVPKLASATGAEPMAAPPSSRRAAKRGATGTSEGGVATKVSPGKGASARTEESRPVAPAGPAGKPSAPKTRPARAESHREGAGGALVEDKERAPFLDHQRELLLAERSNYTRQAEELRAQAEALALEHEPGDVQFDEEGGEGGTVSVDRELDLHLSAQARAAIEEIDAALAKMAAGTYGFCENCGQPIPAARLEALPHARLCVSCKSGGLSARRQ
jgi:DnaK suppressor protein